MYRPIPTASLIRLPNLSGWRSGLTYNQATAARYGGCCRCQNNLDYSVSTWNRSSSCSGEPLTLCFQTQMLNGWFQGKSGYELGNIKNLAVCG